MLYKSSEEKTELPKTSIPNITTYYDTLQNLKKQKLLRPKIMFVNRYKFT